MALNKSPQLLLHNIPTTILTLLS